jgi:phosphoglycerol transferase MdoB-like AlkP superfamily enzyme
MSQSRFHRAVASILHNGAPPTQAPRVAALGELMGRFGSPSFAPECRVALVLCLAPLTLRTVLLLEQSLRLTAADVHGYLSDLTVTAVAAIVLSAVIARLKGRVRTSLAVVTTAVWTLLHVGNYEHVKALGAPLQFTYAQYMRDGVFVAGSAFSVSRLASLVALLLLGIGGIVFAIRGAMTALSWQARAIGVLALGFFDAVWPSNYRFLAWRESHFIPLMLVPSTAKASGSIQPTALPPAFRSNITGDLKGEPILGARKGQPNVLLVILEGITGGSIPSVASVHGIAQAADMPELSALADQNIAYATFVANQRQTNRGEFTLLCGQLDYLVSGTSRMTEYARDGGEPCLPRVLADHGYRTLYLQPAPLSFMLKDQFMTKAGFADVRGHDAFPHAYARSNWGVDDRAFFEQSADVIRELDASGSPWFATLLTVGTHHPYTVPEDFRTGTAIDSDPHARAVRYLDHAVTDFVAKLEASHILDDTLLIITSDESFGVEGYDDVTQLLSYNWGFLIAKVPGEPRRVVTQMHAQTDVALSIADYLQVGTSSFAGRSLFREYHTDRQLVFANTYQEKIYWAKAPNVVECNEALSACQKHTLNGPGLFSPQRTSEMADEADIQPLREMVAITNTHQVNGAAGRMPLMLDNAAVWEMGPDSAALVFGGQYFTLLADQELVVSLDATLSGSGSSLVLDSDLFARAMLYEVLPPTIHEGDRLRFEYVYAPGKATSNVEVRLHARKLSGNAPKLILRKSEMTVRQRTRAEPGGATTRLAVERERPIQTFVLASGVPRDQATVTFQSSPCLLWREGRELVTEQCPHGPLVFGPYANLSRAADLKATFEVASENGSAELLSEIVSGFGTTTYAKSEVVRVGPNAAATITVSACLGSAVDGIEARLALTSSDVGSRLIIRRAVLEVSERPNTEQSPR